MLFWVLFHKLMEGVEELKVVVSEEVNEVLLTFWLLWSKMLETVQLWGLAFCQGTHLLSFVALPFPYPYIHS